MNEFSLQEKMPQEIVSICAMNAVLHTDGVSEMAPLPAMASLGKDQDGAKGIKIAESKKGLEIDDRKVSQVNIHIMGVSPADAKGNEQNR